MQDLSTHCIQSYPCETKSANETEKKAYLNSWSRRTDRQLFIQTTWWNLEKHVKICHGITALQHLIDPRQNGIAERAVRRVKEGTSAVLPQSGLDERWWSYSMECYCYLRSVQDLLPDGKTPYKWRFGEPLKGPIIPFGAVVECHPSSLKDQSIIHQFGKEVLPGIFLGSELIAWGNLERRYLKSRLWKIWNWWMHRIFTLEEWIRFPVRRWYRKIVMKRPRIPSTHSQAGATCNEWRSQWRKSRRIGRVSTGRTYWWRWSPWRFLVDSRWLHPSSSHWTTITTLCAERRNVPYSTKIHWCYQVLDVMQEKKIDDNWNVDSSKHLSDSWRGFTKFNILKEKPPKGYMWSGERMTRIPTTTRPDHVWPEVWTNIGKAVQNREKQEWAKEKPKLDNVRKLRDLLYRSGWQRVFRIYQKRKKKTGKTYGSSHALQAGQTAF